MEGREVFRIEHRETREGAFRACAIEKDWHAFSIPFPWSYNGEGRICDFLSCVSDKGIFAYLSIKSLLHWFEVAQIEELDQLNFHVSVFIVPYDPEAGAFSATQAVFLRDRVQWVRFISLLDL